MLCKSYSQMDPAIDDFHVVVSEVDLARPDAPAKVSEFGRVLSPIYRLARRTHQQEGNGVKDMGDLPHQEESDCPKYS
jgi:hypothetical protein